MLKAVQELCLSFYGVTAVTAESYGCVWHFQQRYAGHDVLEVSLEWTYGAITFLADVNRKSEHVLTSAIASSTRDNGRKHAARECASSKWSTKNRTTSTASPPLPY